jgi:hypothetical protein
VAPGFTATSGKLKLQPQNQPTGNPHRVVDQRRQPRFKIEVPVTVSSRTCGRLRGHTVDISESGISAILKIEVPVGELVELEFTLPFGPVITYAMVRQRNAFRYGFQFVESADEHQTIRDTCRHLEVEQGLGNLS